MVKPSSLERDTEKTGINFPVTKPNKFSRFSCMTLKNILKLTLIGAGALLLAACGGDDDALPSDDAIVEAQPEETPTPAPEPAQESDGLVLDTADQRASYGIGYNIGRSIANEAALEADTDALVAGIMDGLEGVSPRLDNAALEAASNQLQKRAEEMTRQQIQENMGKARAFLEANAKRDGVTVTESGLQFEVIEASTDPDAAQPTPEDKVKVHYTGTLIDGTVFDSSVERGEPISFELKTVIKGWIEGLQLMSVGEKYRFYIPPELGYGPRQSGQIPPSSVLIFDIELLGIED